MAALISRDVLSYIFSLLQLKDVKNVSCVCKAWNAAVVPEIWKNFQLSYFGKYLVPKETKDLNWKQLFFKTQRQLEFPISIPLACSPDSIATGDANGTISLYLPHLYEQGHTFKKILYEGHQGRITCIQLGMNVLVSGSQDRTIRVWYLHSNDRIIFEGHTGAVTCLALLAHNKIVSGSEDTTVRLWSTETAQCLKILWHHLSGITFITNLSFMMMNGPASKLIWGCKQGALSIVDSQHIVANHVHTLEITCCSGTPGLFFTGSKDGTVRCWPSSNQPTSNFFSGHRSPIIGVCLFDKKVYSSSCNGQILECEVDAFFKDEEIMGTVFYQSNATAVYLKGKAEFGKKKFLFGWEGTEVKLWRIAKRVQETHAITQHAAPVVNANACMRHFYSISVDGELRHTLFNPEKDTLSKKRKLS